MSYCYVQPEWPRHKETFTCMKHKLFRLTKTTINNERKQMKMRKKVAKYQNEIENRIQHKSCLF
jgi:hypothetical protein